MGNAHATIAGADSVAGNAVLVVGNAHPTVESLASVDNNFGRRRLPHAMADDSVIAFAGQRIKGGSHERAERGPLALGRGQRAEQPVARRFVAKQRLAASHDGRARGTDRRYGAQGGSVVVYVGLRPFAGRGTVHSPAERLHARRRTLREFGSAPDCPLGRLNKAGEPTTSTLNTCNALATPSSALAMPISSTLTAHVGRRQQRLATRTVDRVDRRDQVGHQLVGHRRAQAGHQVVAGARALYRRCCRS